jgi:hypothetical protein
MTVIPYSSTARARANAARPLDRLLISAGTALAGWGERRAARNTTPSFADQTSGFEGRRHAATRALPMLPR